MGMMNDKAVAQVHYQQHIDDVKETVPMDRLLMFTVDQGWGPLCKFPGVSVPESKFSNVLDRAEVKKTIADITKGAYVFLAIGAVILTGIIFALVRFLG